MENKFSLFNRLKEPIVLKADNSAEEQLEQLNVLRSLLTDEGKSVLETDIRKLEYGILGEKTILFELKNSHMPMFIIHDLFLSDGENTAQIDYLVFTKKVCFIIECKNLYGNIEINEKGEFIRTIRFGKSYKKEGIYSPITQNQRHWDLLKKIKGDKKNNVVMKFLSDWTFNNYYQPIIVLANPSTVLNDKNAPFYIRNKVIRADQLISYIRTTVNISKEHAYSDNDMSELANNILSWDTGCKIDYLAKYEKYKIKQTEKSIIDTDTQTEKETEIAVEETKNVDEPREEWQKDDEKSVESVSLFAQLKSYRWKKCREENIKPYYIYNDKQLDDLIQKMPASKEELLAVSGFGEKKVEKYGDEILEIVKAHG